MLYYQGQRVNIVERPESPYSGLEGWMVMNQNKLQDFVVNVGKQMTSWKSK